MSCTELYSRNGGSNLNAGTLDGTTEPATAPAFTYALGNWDGTSVFTVAGGNPLTDGVLVDQYASVVETTNALICGGHLTGAGASTPDSAALSPVGDIDVRLKINPYNWAQTVSGSANVTVLATKATSANADKSWSFQLNISGALRLEWYVAGGGTQRIATATASVFPTVAINGQALWVRATLDVDNGAGQYAVQFFTSPDGSAWTQLGATVTGSTGVTTVNDGAAPIVLGCPTTLSTTVGGFGGLIHNFEFRSSIGGTVVASPDFTAQAAGTTSFADAQGNTWTVAASGSIGAPLQTSYAARITARGATTITLSTTAKLGFPPPSGTGNRTLRVGGCWAGHSATTNFPFPLMAGTLVNANGDFPRFNFKTDKTYGTSYSLPVTFANIGPYKVEAYTAVAGDGGRFLTTGSTTGLPFCMVAWAANLGLTPGVTMKGFEFRDNGGSGQISAFSVGSGVGGLYFENWCVHDVRGAGFAIGTGVGRVHGLECYNCNQSNTTGIWVIDIGQNSHGSYLYAHHNGGNGSNSGAIRLIAGSINDHVVASDNIGVGVTFNGGNARLTDFALRNNTLGGILFNATSGIQSIELRNGAITKNGGPGITFAAGTTTRLGRISGVAFGSGTEANTGGNISEPTTGAGIDYVNIITLAADVNPWNAPDTGDYRTVLAACRGTGSQGYVQSMAGMAGLVDQPDLGAAHVLGTFPVVGHVRAGDVYGLLNGSVGTSVLPLVGQVRTGVGFGTGGTEFTGTLQLPTTGQVKSGIGYGDSATEFIGTVTLPPVNKVQTPTQYGAAGTEFTGTLVLDYPAVGNVRLGVSYNSGAAVGTLWLPTEDKVLFGTGYGANGLEFTGSYGPFPSLPGTTTGYLTTYDFDGTPVAGVSVFCSADGFTTSAAGAAVSRGVREAVSNVNGLAQFSNMMPSTSYWIWTNDNDRVLVTLPDTVDATYALPSIVGDF